MLARRFAAAARRERDTHLTPEARLVVRGVTAEGVQVRLYRGLRPDETLRSSIGHFLLVSAADLDAHPGMEGERRLRDASTAESELIYAGSMDVRHPSYDHYYGRSGWSLNTSIGRIAIPGDSEHGTLPSLDGEPLFTTPEAIPAEIARIPGHGSAV